SAAGRMRIAIAPSNENVVYFGGLSDGAGFIPSLLHYTYRSSDGSGSGGTWDDRSRNVPSPTDLHDAGGVNTYGGYAEALRVLPTDENTVFFGGTNLFRSTDGFQTSDNIAWIGGYYGPYLAGQYDSTQSYPNHHPDNHDLQFLASDPNTLYSANDGGIYVSHDCLDDNSEGRPIEWTILNSNDKASIVYVVAIDHATLGDTTVLGGFQDQGSWLRTENNSWTQYDGGDGCFCEIADHKAAYYMTSESGYIDQWFLAPDFSYVSSNFDFRPGFGTPEFLSPYELDPNNNNQMYYSAGNSIWIDNDLTNPLQSWTLIENAPGNAFISALTVSTVPGQELFYGTSNGEVFRVDQANTASPVLKEITGAAFPKNAFVSCITVDPQNADSIVVCFSNYHVISIFASNDGGTTWRNVSGNLEQFPDGSGDGPSVRWVTLVHQKVQELYLCGTSVGLFSTADISGSEVTWTQEGVNTIGYATVENIDARQSDGFVAIATQGSGVFTSHVVSDVSGVEAPSIAALSFDIWPNPIANVAQIQFTLSSSARASLRMYDVTGKTVADLAEGNYSEGMNHASFDCTTLPPGSYFIQLETPDAVETRRIVIRH
ncbi:MAG TPA: T9SS type A sorting domain-containing protein, partial [Candidatus Kapabacteria bacterium]